MRETIGGTWITQLVIVFTFVFAAFLALSINYSKAFRVKNQTLSIIERREGIKSSVKYINGYLAMNNYNTMGVCTKKANQSTIYGVTKLSTDNDNVLEVAKKNKKYYYCVSKVASGTENFTSRAYFTVKMFFKFNLPVIGDVFTFDVDGQSKDVNYPYENDIY